MHHYQEYSKKAYEFKAITYFARIFCFWYKLECSFWICLLSNLGFEQYLWLFSCKNRLNIYQPTTVDQKPATSDQERQVLVIPARAGVALCEKGWASRPRIPIRRQETFGEEAGIDSREREAEIREIGAWLARPSSTKQNHNF